MNNALKTAVQELKANPGDLAKIDALKDLAVPKFKKVYADVQSAVRTVNRHLAPGKGMPNRSKLALAIGLTDDINAFLAVGDLIEMKEMTDAAFTLLDVVERIKGMAQKREYAHIDFLPDFLTAPEKREADLIDCKYLLANATDAVRAASKSILKAQERGDYDPNNFKYAKAIGYKAFLANLHSDLVTLDDADTTLDLAYEIGLCVDLMKAIDALVYCKANGWKAALIKLEKYNPFPEDNDDEAEDDGEEDTPPEDTEATDAPNDEERAD